MEWENAVEMTHFKAMGTEELNAVNGEETDN